MDEWMVGWMVLEDTLVVLALFAHVLQKIKVNLYTLKLEH